MNYLHAARPRFTSVCHLDVALACLTSMSHPHSSPACPQETTSNVWQLVEKDNTPFAEAYEVLEQTGQATAKVPWFLVRLHFLQKGRSLCGLLPTISKTCMSHMHVRATYPQETASYVWQLVGKEDRPFSEAHEVPKILSFVVCLHSSNAVFWHCVSRKQKGTQALCPELPGRASCLLLSMPHAHRCACINPHFSVGYAEADSASDGKDPLVRGTFAFCSC